MATRPKKTKPKTKVKKVKKERLNLRKYKALLLAEQERLRRADREIHERTARRNEHNSSESFSDYEDVPADIAAETSEREKDYMVGRNIHELLERVEYALSKIEDKTYGYCDSCGEPIAPKRLEALPYAELCINCQNQLEQL